MDKTPRNLDDIYGAGAENADDEIPAEEYDVESLLHELDKLETLLYAAIKTAGGKLIVKDEHINEFQTRGRSESEIKRINDAANKQVILLA